MSRKSLGLIVGLVLVFSAAAWSQETTGTITGFVKDPTGAIVPNAEVVVRNMGTGVERRVMSGHDGEYVATLLPIGMYEVTVEVQGFKKFTMSNIKLSVNDRLRIDMELQLGEITQVVTSEAVVPAVQTESSEVGGLVSGKLVVEMPLNGRSLYQLIALQPGVSAGSSIVSGRVGVGLDSLSSVNVNGARAAQNNWLIDGADNVDTGSNLAVINYISVESVAEFRILRGNYSAEFGRSGGGQINVVTKTGANDFHGGVFWFFRNDVFDAVPYFSTLDRDKDGKYDPPLLRYHNFGWNISGPIFKDKLFFFYNQEIRRTRIVRGAGLVQARVPTELQRGGNFSELLALATPVYLRDPSLTGTCSAADQTACFPGNIIPAGRQDANALKLMALIPPANVPGVAVRGLNFQAATPAGRNFREELVRVDWNASAAHKFFGRWVRDKMPNEEPFGEIFGSNQTNLPGVASTQTVMPARNIVGEWTWVVSPRMVNNFAMNFSRGGIFTELTGKGTRDNITGLTVPELFPENPGNLVPGISLGQYSGWDFFGPYWNSYGSRRFKDTLSFVRGKHAFKMGYLYSWEFKNENAASGVNGAFAFPGVTSSTFVSTNDGFADFLLGRASSFSEKDIDITSHLRYPMHEAFIQDDWKMLSNLTVNIGLRWSFIIPPRDTENLLTNFDPKLFNTARAYQISSANVRVPGTGDPCNGLYIAAGNTTPCAGIVVSPYGERIVESHWETFGPRIGLAWDPWGDGKTALRAGYGIYFDRTLVGIALQNAFVNPPFVRSLTYAAAQPTGGVPTLSDPQAGALRDPEAILPSLITMSPNFLVPTTQHWSLGVQRELPWQVSLDIAYVGNHATHLLRAVRINQTPVGTTAPAANRARYRGWGTITERQTSASSSYNSLQIAVNKRMSKGLMLNSAYTFSRVITDSPDDRSTIPQDSYNLRAERALASFDKTHIFVVNWIYEFPFFKNARRAIYNIAGGWQIGGIFRAESGTPLTVTFSGTQARVYYGGTERPNQIADPMIAGPVLTHPDVRCRTTISQGGYAADEVRVKASWFNTCAFTFPALDTFGNARRGLIRGPGLNLWDLVVYKHFVVTERLRMQFRAEFFNAFNHPNLSGVSTGMGSTTSRGVDFGKVTGALAPREVQLALKLTF